MRVQGTEIDDAALATVRAWIARQTVGFTFGDVADKLRRAKVPYAISDRATNRLLQQMKRAGVVAFRDGYWHTIPAPEIKETAA